MGCDIHFNVQRRDPETGEWRVTPYSFDCAFCNATGKYGPERRNAGETCYFCKGTGKETDFSDRNYELFAILADVRNRQGIIPIAPPKGVPQDGSLMIKNDDGWERYFDFDGNELDLGEHSMSWFTVSELLAYNWDQTFEQSGIVDLNTYKEWKASGALNPGMYCQGSSGPGIIDVTEEQLAAMAADPSLVKEGTRPQARCRWQLTYREEAGRFLTSIIPALQALGDPDDVRIVFGFDN